MNTEASHGPSLAYRCLDVAQLAIATLAMISAIGLAPLVLTAVQNGLKTGQWLSTFCELNTGADLPQAQCYASSPWRFLDAIIDYVTNHSSVILGIACWYLLIFGAIWILRTVLDKITVH
jgi:hypothetical protein